jgi:hypothetical protein
MMFIAFSASGLYAQGYGTISGTVTDPSGASVASATVKAIQTQTGRETVVTSGREGDFVFPTLPPSVYSLSVSATGFQSYTQTDIVAASRSEADRQCQTEGWIGVGDRHHYGRSAAGGHHHRHLISGHRRDRVVDLPLNGRNAATLITLVAGVVDATNEGNGVNQGNGKTFPAAVVTSANGTLPNQSNYLLNGGNNVDEMTNVNGPFPFPDASRNSAFRPATTNAEFGQSAGAVVNIVTKSGGSKFHGDAFEFLRNGYFNAKPLLRHTADNLHRHQFGGTIGGPVIIPHFPKDRAPSSSSAIRTRCITSFQRLFHNGSHPGGRRTRRPTLCRFWQPVLRRLRKRNGLSARTRASRSPIHSPTCPIR